MDYPEDRKKLLLISNSVCHGRPYLEHCADAIRQFLEGAATITFVPYAAKDWDGYASQVRSAFAGAFQCLGLVSFQINPHYIDADPNSKHMGETREKRIAEFHEENNLTVIGLREGSWIAVDQGRATLHGETGAKIFVKGEAPTEWERQTDRPAW